MVSRLRITSKKTPLAEARGVFFRERSENFSGDDQPIHSSTASSFVLVLRDGVSRSNFI
ncbi:hypothetical protein KR51_00033380 [Rubidibacter lacunae KORDI 51-2]|uniref:Uncharacterized protein n=1 Tax=Rubidibacter lacunae KORDI 51-2 TaxID=582515 RepID=U5DHJ4_9CHRO|nr:hypothetical protein KR51_00033380 [Rubidibacter lacunae KORDI 51-2]